MSNQGGLYAAVSGAIAQEKRLEVLTNNLANVNTTGYKKDALSFRSLLTEAEKAQGSTTLVSMSAFYTDYSQGGVHHTGNPLDLALSGEGFFEIETAEGVRYTRQGNFLLNSENELVNIHGDPVSGTGGPLILDGSLITIAQDGQITVDESSVGQIKIVNINDLQRLEKAGKSLFINTGGKANLTTDSPATVLQEHLELSNVNQVEEMVKLIEISRAYESFQKVIQSMDESSKKLVNEVGAL